MPKVHRVKRSRKLHGKCTFAGCVFEIGIGHPYIWWKGRFMPKRVRCLDHPPRRSDLTGSDKLATLYSAEERVEDEMKRSDVTIGDIVEALKSAGEDARQVSEDYEESAAAVEEFFPGSSTVEDIRESGYAAMEWSDQLFEIAEQIEGDWENLSVNQAREQASDVLAELEL